MDSLQLSTSQCHLLAWMQNCGLDPGPMPLPSASTLPQLFKQARGIDEKFLFVFLTNTDSICHLMYHWILGKFFVLN